MGTASKSVEIFYLDDMEDEVIITELNLRRQNLDLNIGFYLDEFDMLSTLGERRDKSLSLPNLIVTDLNMPGRGGAHLVKALRTDAAYQDVTIGICTGSENSADHTAALASGADFVAVKPFDRSSLVTICEKTGRFQLIQRDDGKNYLCAVNTSP
ncbi:MAG: response regulator [Geminicoccaceae bacterium]